MARLAGQPAPKPPEVPLVQGWTMLSSNVDAQQRVPTVQIRLQEVGTRCSAFIPLEHIHSFSYHSQVVKRRPGAWQTR